jgi:C_GCAxxG_C_C family probable redox protein
MSDNSINAESMFLEGYNCAQAVLIACGAQYGLPRETAIRVAQAFGGGMGRTGNICGAVTGALMVIGLKCAVKDAKDAAAKEQVHRLAQQFLAQFKTVHGSITCRELLGYDLLTEEGRRLVHEKGLTKTVCAKLVENAAEIVDRLSASLTQDDATPQDRTHKIVKEAFARIARKQTSCCDKPRIDKSSCCEKSDYTVPDHPVPEAELGLSCGNPIAFGHIREGDAVLDLGSGAGKDVFLAAQKVGRSGRAIGVDMTPEMLQLARQNAAKFFTTTGLKNVEFREGTIENLPVEDKSIDVVVSNCVINLSTDKPRVFREVHRVLKDGGRMVVSDIVLNRPLPLEAKSNSDLYTSCIAGALLRDQYLAAIRAAGFGKVEILSDKTYKTVQAGEDPVTKDIAHILSGVAASITVLAVKPEEPERNNMRIDQMDEKMLQAVIEALPVEITVIDAQDEVIGWNKHDNRLFKRPLTSMGLNFRQCHPEKSLAMVEQIVSEMRQGTRDLARFWIDLPVHNDTKKHKIMIEFYALRDPSGKYIGCMEAALDVEPIRDLKGEKRLLD